MTPPNYASILCTKIGQKKLNGSVSPQNLQKAPKTPIARPSITPILRMDQVSSIYNPGNDFFWREEGPCRARARTSPARPSLGVPPTRFRGFPVTALSQTRLNLQVNSSLGQPAWFATVPWTGTSRSQVGVPPRMSLYFINILARGLFPFRERANTLNDQLKSAQNPFLAGTASGRVSHG